VALKVPCPNCGWRPSTEFAWGGELRPIDAADAESDFARVFLPANAAGPQQERWFHLLGCRRWLTVTRDTTTNEIR
jgi:heterotetrameric sarcosine oxidase delta subunit